MNKSSEGAPTPPLSQDSGNSNTGNGATPLYKKWWFWVIIALLFLGLVGSCSQGAKKDITQNEAENSQNQQSLDNTTQHLDLQSFSEAMQSTEYSFWTSFHSDVNEDGVVVAGIFSGEQESSEWTTLITALEATTNTCQAIYYEETESIGSFVFNVMSTDSIVLATVENGKTTILKTAEEMTTEKEQQRIAQEEAAVAEAEAQRQAEEIAAAEAQRIADEEAAASSNLADTIVYITNNGTKYHRDGCRHLKSKIETTLSSAKASGYEPCKTCNPPQ